MVAGYFGLHCQSSPMACTGACSGLLLVALAAGLGAREGTVTGWLWVRLTAQFWGLGYGWGTGFAMACTHCGVLGLGHRVPPGFH